MSSAETLPIGSVSTSPMLAEQAELSALIEQRLGLVANAHDLRKAMQWLRVRARAQARSVPQLMDELRQQDSDHSQAWGELIANVTNGESYFFRDEGQISLLENHLLPDLIERQRAHKVLRIWSAGCSRGEEIYSIAMLLREQLPDANQWRLELHGSDINPNVLNTAREGLYNEWSFRRTSDNWRQRYFHPVGRQWRINEEVRRMVRFHTFNLADTPKTEQSLWLHHMDLILCRNVIIYFKRSHIPQVLDTFANALAPDGLLMTGHAELLGYAHKALEPRLHPGSLVFQKINPIHANPLILVPLPSAPLKPAAQVRSPSRPPHMPSATTPRAAPNSAAPTPARPLRPTPTVTASVQSSVKASITPSAASRAVTAASAQTTSLHQATQQFMAGHYREALVIAQGLGAATPMERAQVDQLMAQCHVNLGDYAAAITMAKQALQGDEFSPSLHYLSAHIFELAGDVDQAIAMLERAIYLDSDFVAAYVDLAALLDNAERKARALQLRQSALMLLRRRPPNEAVTPYEHVSAQELIHDIEALLAQGSRPKPVQTASSGSTWRASPSHTVK